MIPDRAHDFQDQVLEFLSGVYEKLPVLPDGINLIETSVGSSADPLIRQFYSTFYSDNKKRKLILGINPGRHGSGTTGIPFTDGIHLNTDCNIPNTINSKELSAQFMYEMMQSFGGADIFYQQFFISSVSPLGFTKMGKNFNYYDDQEFTNRLTEYIVHQMNRLIKLPLDKEKIYCLGEGKNYKFLVTLNEQHKCFSQIYPLPHPRFIMQYKRKEKSKFIQKYLQALSEY